MGTSTLAYSPPDSDYDLEAYNELAAMADGSDSAFELDCIDRGLDRLVAQPNRSASGKRLAWRLVRDARKYLLSTCRDIPTDEIEKANPNSEPPTPEELDDVRRAVGIIRDGLSNLDNRNLLVLIGKFTGNPDPSITVKGRQYRNLVSAARERLRVQPGVARACELVTEALGRWRYETVELLTPLLSAVRS